MALGPWTYPALAGLVGLDAIAPLVPSEAAVVAAAVSAGSPAAIAAVVAAAAAGAMLGDVVMHGAGRVLGRRPSVAALAARFRGADGQHRHVGAAAVVAGRFLPGGRTAVAVASGVEGMPLRRYLAVDALAAGLWAIVMLFAGRAAATMTTSTVAQLGIGVGFVVAIGACSAAVSRHRRRRSVTSVAGATATAVTGATATAVAGASPTIVEEAEAVADLGDERGVDVGAERRLHLCSRGQRLAERVDDAAVAGVLEPAA
jgi:membrane-associated protein